MISRPMTHHPMTHHPLNFHPSAWKFRAGATAPRSTPDGLPPVRVEIHRDLSHRPTSTGEGRHP